MDIAGKLWTKVRKTLSPPKIILRITDAGGVRRKTAETPNRFEKYDGILDARGGAKVARTCTQISVSQD